MEEVSMLQESTITYKSISTDPVPPGLRDIASEITTVVLIAQPIHLYSFIADYLQATLMARDSNESPAYRMIRNMVENELTYEAMLQRWGVSTALANFAATIIQAVYRGHRTRIAMGKKTPEADPVIEEKFSELLPDSQVHGWDEATKAAICIQRNFRQIAGQAKKEKPPGEPQQRRRARRSGPPNLHQPPEVVTAPAELTTAYESTAKEAAMVVTDPVQSSSDPVQVAGSFLGQEAKPSVKQKSKQSVATPRKKESKQAVTTPRKQVSKQSVATPRKKESKKAVTTPRKQVSKQAVATSDNEEAKQSVTELNKQVSKQAVATSDNEEAKQSVTELNKQVSKQEVATSDNEEAKQSVTELNKQVSKQEVATSDNEEAKQSATELNKQVSKQEVATSDNEEAKQSVTELNKRVSKQEVATSDNEEAKQSVTELNKQVSKQEVATLDNEEAKQSATELNKQVSKHGVAASDNEEAKQPATRLSKQTSTSENDETNQSVTNLHKQVSKHGVATTDNEEGKQPVATLKKHNSAIPLSGVAESIGVVLPIIDSLLWYVVNEQTRDPVSEIKAPVEATSRPASQQVAASKNDAKDAAPKLESLFSSSPNQYGVFTPGEQSRHTFADNHRSTIEAVMSAIFTDRLESVSVFQPPSRAAMDVDSQEFYQAQECPSLTKNERAQLLLNRSSNSIQTKNESSTRAVSLQSEIDVTRSEFEMARTRRDDDHERNHNNWAESEPLLPSVDVANDEDTFDRINDYDNIISDI